MKPHASAAPATSADSVKQCMTPPSPAPSSGMSRIVSSADARVWMISGLPYWRAARMCVRNRSRCHSSGSFEAIIVEPGFADGNDLRVIGQSSSRSIVGSAVSLGIGMHADRGVQPVAAPRQRTPAGNSLKVVNVQRRLDPGIAHSLQHARQVLRQLRKRQMAVGIYKHHFVAGPPGRRSQTTGRPAGGIPFVTACASDEPISTRRRARLRCVYGRSARSSAGKCTPMPGVLLPPAAGLIHTTFPATGIRVGSSSSVRIKYTSSPN